MLHITQYDWFSRIIWIRFYSPTILTNATLIIILFQYHRLKPPIPQLLELVQGKNGVQLWGGARWAQQGGPWVGRRQEILPCPWTGTSGHSWTWPQSPQPPARSSWWLLRLGTTSLHQNFPHVSYPISSHNHIDRCRHVDQPGPGNGRNHPCPCLEIHHSFL